MECRETGEFAHREKTQYEQLETFNEEVFMLTSLFVSIVINCFLLSQLVGEVRGTEEYVHLKSKEDEFQFMESTMPKKAPEDSAEGEPVSGEEKAEEIDDPTSKAAEAYEQYLRSTEEKFTEDLFDSANQGIDHDAVPEFISPMNPDTPRGLHRSHNFTNDSNPNTGDTRFQTGESVEHPNRFSPCCKDDDQSRHHLFGDKVDIVEDSDVPFPDVHFSGAELARSPEQYKNSNFASGTLRDESIIKDIPRSDSYQSLHEID